MGGAAREEVRFELTFSEQDWQGLGVSRSFLERMVASALVSVSAPGSRTPTYGKGDGERGCRGNPQIRYCHEETNGKAVG